MRIPVTSIRWGATLLAAAALMPVAVQSQSYPVKPMNMPHQEFAAVVKESRAAYVSLFSRISIKLQ